MPQYRLDLGRARRTVTVRDLAAKSRITAALLGCASQKGLCARFHEVNPGTSFDLDRSYKWMQGRAQPRSAGVYEDWATLLGTTSPIWHLQSCTIGEFLDLVCDCHEVSREALASRAGVVMAAKKAIEPEPVDLLPGRHLIGAYACYCPSWSPYAEGKIVRGSLVIEAARGSGFTLAATYGEAVAVGRALLRGPVAVLDGAIHIDVADDASRFRLAMCLFVPGRLASVLAGVISGVALLDVLPQPTASRIVMIRIAGTGVAVLEASNGYLDPVTTPLSSDLIALGLPVTAADELDTLLDEFLTVDQPSRCIKVAADEFSRLTLAIDRLLIARGVTPQSKLDPFGASAG